MGWWDSFVAWWRGEARAAERRIVSAGVDQAGQDAQKTAEGVIERVKAWIKRLVGIE